MAMNLNSASEQELTQLPRVAADKARRIVHYRAIRRGFRDWADFARTPGITEADLEAIRTRAWIGPPEEGGAGEATLRTGRRPRGKTTSTTRFRRWSGGPAAVRRPRR